jgi:plastocyanin
MSAPQPTPNSQEIFLRHLDVTGGKFDDTLKHFKPFRAIGEGLKFDPVYKNVQVGDTVTWTIPKFH